MLWIKINCKTEVVFGGQDSWQRENTNAGDCTFGVEESRIWKLDKKELNSKWKETLGAEYTSTKFGTG